MSLLNNRRRRIECSPSDEFTLATCLERLGLIDPCQTPDLPFTQIGGGTCGAVFGRSGPFVIKLSKTDNHETLWNDYNMHTRFAQLFDMWREASATADTASGPEEFDEVSIPACYYFVPPDEPRFFAQHPGLTEAARELCKLPTSALVTERIRPLPKRARDLMIDKYCAEGIRDMARAEPANCDCLARVYLGSARGRGPGVFFTLRNFKLHLNQIMALQLDVRALARSMGIALAIMHWAAETDARGIEFVLGSSSKTKSLAMGPGRLARLPPLSYTGPASRKTEDFFCEIEETKLWVLDFDKVQPITMDEKGVAKAVEAARANDPYIPKPLQDSPDAKEVWAAFAMSYLEAGNEILVNELGSVLELPLMFIQGLVDAEREK